jgi:signal transduction histidine kinase
MSSISPQVPKSQPRPQLTTVSSYAQPISYARMVALALAAAAVVFLISAVLDWTLIREHESRRAVIEMSDALSGLIAGALVFRLLQYERERRRQIRQRLETIGDMNHHIRNALQVISGTAYSAADKEQLAAIRESVGRIQWALREILPKL